MYKEIEPLKNKISMFKADQKYFINVYEVYSTCSL